ncbi:hypothetical protein P154DRAFT_441659 [Amniculicola lignicola CBS 123094]|uniref:RNA binding protein Nrd1 n=1 Tax=Amniculicola lignicola CBS 123094 TaxID=1392246 RepID=A0A6A5W7T6_9PLEO|nr:hypothetical protein P154DRAFT_441659 [Amniculicola lignicola CBS 123094]
MVAMDELEPLLQSLQTLKAPGITKTKIDAITQLCVQNVQSDTAIVQKIVQAFKNSPTTHKLGVLYIVDSVTRQWMERAKQASQTISKNAAAGTFGSGVQKVTDVLPTLMSDLVQSVPENQKEKVSKLLDIWERGSTFPQAMLAAFKMQLTLLQQAQAQAGVASMAVPPPQQPAMASMPPMQSATQNGTDGAMTDFNDPSHGRNDRNEYRQRSPPAQRRPSPIRGNQQKFLEWDYNMPRDHIKVLSRTLFVGGASGTEDEIRDIFSRFGRVQTCIVAQEKRHAFVKMVNRVDACAAKEGMDKLTDTSALAKARQTRWGVGFGPRDCSDYNSGISVIPISRLTDADRKWVVNAEFGGTGGRPLEAGMVLEEPDIEIGAGVSSKG